MCWWVGRRRNFPRDTTPIEWAAFRKHLWYASPALLLNSLRRASLIAHWYAGNTPARTLELVKHELDQQRPVIALIKQRVQGHPLLLEWQVIFKMDEARVYTKHSAVEDGTHANPIEAFIDMISMDHAQLSCSVITARKE